MITVQVGTTTFDRKNGRTKKLLHSVTFHGEKIASHYADHTAYRLYRVADQKSDYLLHSVLDATYHNLRPFCPGSECPIEQAIWRKYQLTCRLTVDQATKIVYAPPKN